MKNTESNTSKTKALPPKEVLDERDLPMIALPTPKTSAERKVLERCAVRLRKVPGEAHLLWYSEVVDPQSNLVIARSDLGCMQEALVWRQEFATHVLRLAYEMD